MVTAMILASSDLNRPAYSLHPALPVLILIEAHKQPDTFLCQLLLYFCFICLIFLDLYLFCDCLLCNWHEHGNSCYFSICIFLGAGSLTFFKLSKPHWNLKILMVENRVSFESLIAYLLALESNRNFYVLFHCC